MNRQQTGPVSSIFGSVGNFAPFSCRDNLSKSEQQGALFSLQLEIKRLK
jgi:hypothetical protein